MSKLELLGLLVAEKLTKQKWKQYCGTPCTYLGLSETTISDNLRELSKTFLDNYLKLS